MCVVRLTAIQVANSGSVVPGGTVHPFCTTKMGAKAVQRGHEPFVHLRCFADSEAACVAVKYALFRIAGMETTTSAGLGFIREGFYEK